MPTIKDIEERQKRLMAMFEALQREEDMTRYLQIVQQMEQEARDLESTALAFEAEATKRQRRATGFIEVLLTNDQRTKVLRETGINMTTVLISDPGGEVNASMPGARPEDIEKEALRQATKTKLDREARERARMELERQLDELAGQNELVAAQVAKVREDPKVRAILDPKK
jgi:hypothetical protein